VNAYSGKWLLAASLVQALAAMVFGVALTASICYLNSI
jgi:hypothetical protein